MTSKHRIFVSFEIEVFVNQNDTPQGAPAQSQDSSIVKRAEKIFMLCRKCEENAFCFETGKYSNIPPP